MLMKGVGAFLFIVTESSSTPQFHSTLTTSSHFHDLEYRHCIIWFKTKLIFSQSRVCTVSDPAFFLICKPALKFFTSVVEVPSVH